VVTNDVAWLAQQNQHWAGLQSLIMIESTREIIGRNSTGTASVERRYDISSLPAKAAWLGQTVRAQWGIENSMHWVLDVAFREDDCRVRVGEAAQNFAILRRIALNLLKNEKTTKLGVASKRLKAGWNSDYLSKVLGMAILSFMQSPWCRCESIDIFTKAFAATENNGGKNYKKMLFKYLHFI
jgi:predicted transposase YbfD/YdcC